MPWEGRQGASHSRRVKIVFPRLLGSPTGCPPLAVFLDPPSSPHPRRATNPPIQKWRIPSSKPLTRTCTQKYHSFSFYGAPSPPLPQGVQVSRPLLRILSPGRGRFLGLGTLKRDGDPFEATGQKVNEVSSCADPQVLVRRSSDVSRHATPAFFCWFNPPPLPPKAQNPNQCAHTGSTIH